MSVHTAIEYLEKSDTKENPIERRALIRLAIKEAEAAYQQDLRDNPAPEPHNVRRGGHMGGRWTGNKA